MISKIMKWGNSQGMRFSKETLQEAQLALGDEVEVCVTEEGILIKPAHKVRGRYELRQLLDASEKWQASEVTTGKARGKEVW
jgi:antitoxin MazE